MLIAMTCALAAQALQMENAQLVSLTPAYLSGRALAILASMRQGQVVQTAICNVHPAVGLNSTTANLASPSKFLTRL